MASITAVSVDDDDSFEEVESPWVPVATTQQMKWEQEKSIPEEAPSKPSADLPEVIEIEDDPDEPDVAVIEELFPPGKSAELEEFIKKAKPEPLIGLEYVIEIQHNTIKKVPPNFSCLLCDFHVRKLNGSASNFDLIRGHLRSLAHKLKYLTRFFPTVRSAKFSTKAPVNVDILNHVLEKICSKFGAVKIKVVIGHKLFKKKMPDIKKMIEDSTHFCEDQEIISDICGTAGKAPPQPELSADKATSITVKMASTRSKKSKAANSEKAKKTAAAAPKSKIDEYEDAFTELEKGFSTQNPNQHLKERWSQKTKAAEANPSKSLDPLLANRPRNLDALPLDGTNPGLSLPKVVSVEMEKSAKDGQKSTSREKSEKGQTSSSSRRHRRSGSSSSDGSSRSRSGSRDRRRSRRSRRRSRSRSWSPLEDRRRERVSEYLNEVAVLERSFEKKKLEQMNEPSKHPKYQSSWNQFYKQKCKERGGQPVAAGEITNEWIGVWKDLFFRFHEEELKQEKSRLLNQHRLFYKDVEEFQKQERGGATNVRTEKPAKSAAPERKADPDSDAVNVIGNLRFLSALEMLLDELGSDVIRCLGRANSLDANGGKGASNEMIHDRDFFKLMGAARDKLLEKASQPGRLNANQLSAARTCIGSLGRLLEKSRCHGLGENALSDADIDLKARIVNVVATKFSQAGTDVSSAEFNRIVDYEFKRARQMASSSPPREIAPQSSLATATAAAINWGALESAVQTASSMHAQKPTSADSASDQGYNSLSISDLAVLFRSFQSLDQENQRKLVEHMKYLESTNPEKVQQLRNSLHGFLS